jgi:hypothetical protein
MTNSPGSTDLHLKVTLLLDAYDTDEVSPQERQEVEVHLAACTACRQTLAEIRQLRPLLQQLGDQAARQVLEGLSSSTSAPGRSSLAETVTVALTARAQEQKQRSDHSRKSPFSSPMTRKFISKRWMTGALAVAAVLLIGVVLLSGVLTGLQRPMSQSRPAPRIWDMPQSQTYFQQGGLIFNIKWIEVTAQEFRFFYVLKAGSGEHLHASVHVVDPDHPLARALQTSVQPLGMLGVFHIGVIHAQLTNRAGQTLSLALRWEDRTQNITWTLTPLKQINEDPRGEYADLWADQTQLRAVILIGPEAPGGIRTPLMAAFSSVVTHGSSHTRQSIFLQVSDPLKVTLITKAQFCSSIHVPKQDQALPELCE